MRSPERTLEQLIKAENLRLPGNIFLGRGKPPSDVTVTFKDDFGNLMYAAGTVHEEADVTPEVFSEFVAFLIEHREHIKNPPPCAELLDKPAPVENGQISEFQEQMKQMMQKLEELGQGSAGAASFSTAKKAELPSDTQEGFAVPKPVASVKEQEQASTRTKRLALLGEICMEVEKFGVPWFTIYPTKEAMFGIELAYGCDDGTFERTTLLMNHDQTMDFLRNELLNAKNNFLEHASAHNRELIEQTPRAADRGTWGSIIK